MTIINNTIINSSRLVFMCVHTQTDTALLPYNIQMCVLHGCIHVMMYISLYAFVQACVYVFLLKLLKVAVPEAKQSPETLV